MSDSLKRRLDGHSVVDPKTGAGCGRERAIQYGLVRASGRLMTAHRADWIATHGPIPKSLHVCHRCDTLGCIDPDHLFLETSKENMADKVKKRHRPGPAVMPVTRPEIVGLVLGCEIMAEILATRPAKDETST